MASAETAIRAQVEASGGQLAQQARRLAKRFGFKDLDAGSAGDIENRLRQIGVGVDPSLSAVSGREFVTLYLLEREPARQPQQQPSQQTAGLQEAMAAAESGAGFAAVATGAVITGLVFTALGFAGYWLYGAIYVVLTVLTLGLIRWRLPWLVRLFLPRLRFLRFGWSLGVATMLPLAILVGLLVITPIVGVRDAQAREREAKALVAQANRDMDRDNLNAADRHLDEAEDRDDDAPGLDEARDRLDDEREEAAEEEDKAERYEAAEDDMRDNQYREAIDGMADLGDYRDAEEREREFRATASRETLTRARRTLPRNATRAIALGEEADGYRSTRETRVFLRRARIVLAERRSRIRAARRARDERRAALREQRRQEAAEQRRQEELQRQQEEEALSAPAPDVGGSPGCLPQSACPGKRDGDGDGCYCE